MTSMATASTSQHDFRPMRHRVALSFRAPSRSRSATDLNVNVIDLGELHLRNIGRPVRVYALHRRWSRRSSWAKPLAGVRAASVPGGPAIPDEYDQPGSGVLRRWHRLRHHSRPCRAQGAFRRVARFGARLWRPRTSMCARSAVSSAFATSYMEACRGRARACVSAPNSAMPRREKSFRSDQYEGELGDLFALQDRIALSVVKTDRAAGARARADAGDAQTSPEPDRLRSRFAGARSAVPNGLQLIFARPAACSSRPYPTIPTMPWPIRVLPFGTCSGSARSDRRIRRAMPLPAPDMRARRRTWRVMMRSRWRCYAHAQSFLLHDLRQGKRSRGARHCRRPELCHGLDHGERDVRLSGRRSYGGAPGRAGRAAFARSTPARFGMKVCSARLIM